MNGLGGQSKDTGVIGPMHGGGLDLHARVVKVVFEVKVKKTFLSGKNVFCRLESLGSGDFASNSAFKM